MTLLRFVAVAALSRPFSCALPGQTDSVTVFLPETPLSWSDVWGPAGYRICWRAWAGPGGALEVEPKTGKAVIDLPKGAVVTVLAWPVWQSGGPALQPGETLRPAGGVWSGEGGEPLIVSLTGEPAGDTDSGLRLGYSAGPAASVLHEAARRGVDIRTFNFRRLEQEISIRLPEDPWLLDTGRLVQALCEESMRVDYIREIERREVQLEVPEGEWISVSPFASMLPGGDQSVAVAVGLTSYYDGRGRRLVVNVDEQYRARCFISPPD